MANHYLSVIALALAGTPCLAAGPNPLATLPVSPPAKAFAADSVQAPAARQGTRAVHEALERETSEILAAKEAQLAGRFLTQFADAPEGTRPDRMAPAASLGSLAAGKTSRTAAPLQRKAFHIPGDSLQMIAKDHSFNGSLYIAQVTARQDGDSIALENLYNWGSQEGFRAPRAFVADNGAVTIPAQKVMDHKTYGEIWIAPMRQQNGTIIYSFDPITGQMDASGNITVGGWGLFVPAGDRKNTLFNAFSGSEIKPCNATYASRRANNDDTVTGYALIEQTSAGELALYNVAGGGYGEVLYARMTPQKTALISPQKVFTNPMLGEFYCYPAQYTSDGKAQVDTKGNITLSVADGGFTLSPWAITARGATNYAAAFYLNTVITSSFKPAWPESHAVTFAGKGTQAEPYKLASANDFAVLAEKVNAGDQGYASAYYELGGDIDWSALSYAFVPVGTEANPWAGHLDGKNHTIRNFTVNGRGFMQAALFGYTGPGSTISNLNMTDVKVETTGRYAACVAAQSWSTMTNVKAEGTVTSRGECAGGLTAWSSAPVSEGSFSGTITSGGTVGGIAGEAYASISHSRVNANLAAVGYMSTMYKYVGGIAGTVMYSANVMLPVSVTDCYVQGQVSDNLGYANVGGITALLANGATIARCFNTASISAKRVAGSESDNPAAGIVAWSREGSVTDCYNAGTVVKSGNSEMVGGIVGYLSVGYQYSTDSGTSMLYQTEVRNCYNSAQVISSEAVADKGVFGSTYYREGFDPIGACIFNCYTDYQVLGLRGSKYGLSTASLTSGQLPKDFSADVWQAAKGHYPTLRTIADDVAVRLSGVAMTIAEGETSAKFKSPAALTQAEGIEWKIVDTETNAYVDATEALQISGSTLSVRDHYANALVVAKTREGGNVRIYRLAVVPKLFDGEGTEQNPYLVKSVADFRLLHEAVATYQQPHEGDYFRMTGDIDFAVATGFRGVGAGYNPAIGFGGIFDGQNHTIRNLKIQAVAFDGDGKATTDGSYTYSGLFNNILATGVVRNLNIGSDCSFSHWGPGGSVSGYNMGLIENCRSYAPQSAITDYVGGITGFNTGTLRGCYNAGALTLGRVYAGGIAGANTGRIELCQNDADVTGSAFNAFITSKTQNAIGGIAGGTNTDASVIISCLNQGTVTGARQVGGIIGVCNQSVLRGNINTGMVNCWLTDPTQGAMAGNLTRLEGENNFFDGSVVVAGAALSSGRPGFTSLSTAELTSGKAPASLPDADKWTFAANAYPVLKAFADEPLAKSLRTMYVAFASGETRANVQRNTPLSPAQGLTFALKADQSLFSVSGGSLNVTPAQGNTIGRDTLSITAANAARLLPVQTVPVLFAGAGTEQNPYQIKTVDDINRLSQFIYATGFDYANTHFKVMNDITFAATDTLSPIAKGQAHQFNGVFDGNGKRISGYKYENTVITNTASKPHPMGYPGRYMGFFGKIGSSGRVSNLTLDGSMSLYAYAGGVVGDLYGTVENCTVSGSIASVSQGYAGGIASRVYAGGVVRGCTFKGAITAKTGNNGGIVSYAYADALIENCTMEGSISGTTTNGGIVASLYTTVRGCKTTKDAKFTVTSTLGGIAGQAYTTARIEDCHNYADLKAATTSVSDFSGILSKTTTKGVGVYIRGCSNHGDITSKSYTSGIVGRLLPGNSVEDCVNYGNITSTGASQTGGIVAGSSSAQTDFPVSISRCVNYGEIHGFASYIGGVAGEVNTSCTIDSCINYGNVFSTATSSHMAVGGVAGVTRGHATRCLNAGTVSTVGHGTGGVTGLVQSGSIDRCANLGDVASTGQFPTSGNKNGMVGGLIGYTVTSAAVYNSYSMGELSGPFNMGGLIGRAAASTGTPDIPLENCFTFGRLTVTGEGDDLVSANLYVRNSGVNVVWKNIYYNSDVNTTVYRYDPSGRGRSEQQLQTVELGDEYTLDRAMLPRLNWLVGNDAADLAAISLAFTKAEDKASNVNDVFYVGYPKDGLQWELSDGLRMSVSDPGKVYPVKLGPATISVKSADGKFSRLFNLTVNRTSGVDEFGIDAPEAVSTEYFDLQGARIVSPAPGAIVIVRTVYSDGTVTTAKRVVR